MLGAPDDILDKIHDHLSIIYLGQSLIERLKIRLVLLVHHLVLHLSCLGGLSNQGLEIPDLVISQPLCRLQVPGKFVFQQSTLLVGCLHECEDFLGKFVQETLDVVKVVNLDHLLVLQNPDGLGMANVTVLPLFGVYDNQLTWTKCISVHLKHIVQLLVISILATSRNLYSTGFAHYFAVLFVV